MRNIIKILLVVVALGAAKPVLAGEVGESIVFNPVTGHYLITYLNSTDDTLRQIIFIPATKFNPTLKSTFRREVGMPIHYEYTLTSGRESQQDIVSLILDPVSSVVSDLPDIPLNAPPGKIMGDMNKVANYFDTPVSWDAFMAYSRSQMTFRVGWGWDYKLETGGLTPGSKAVFGFKSRDLPGIIRAELHSYAEGSQNIPSGEVDDEDGGFGQQYTELAYKNNHVPRYAAVPTIAVPSPFDAAVTLERIRANTHTWIGMKLLDTTFSSQLDRSLTAAADAYRRNQLQAGRDHIQDVRLLLKRAYADIENEDIADENTGNNQGAQFKNGMIARLAARVLDFNVKYVLTR